MSEGRRRGRPPLPPEQRKTRNLTIRTLPFWRERLEQAAKASGRSLAGEVEHRVTLSFLMDDIEAYLDKHFGVRREEPKP